MNYFTGKSLFHARKHKNILCEGNINSPPTTDGKSESERASERARESTFWEIVKCSCFKLRASQYCALSFRHYNNHVCDDVSWKLWALAFRVRTYICVHLYIFGFHLQLPLPQFGRIQLILFWFLVVAHKNTHTYAPLLTHIFRSPTAVSLRFVLLRYREFGVPFFSSRFDSVFNCFSFS